MAAAAAAATSGRRRRRREEGGEMNPGGTRLGRDGDGEKRDGEQCSGGRKESRMGSTQLCVVFVGRDCCGNLEQHACVYTVQGGPVGFEPETRLILS